jgi:hypothetical protein
VDEYRFMDKIYFSMAIPAKTFDEVLSELDQIIEASVQENNFLGIFAYVYRRTTAQIKQAVLDKQFDDNARMELLDVTFANLYLTAFRNYSDKKPCSLSWETAFSAKNDRMIIMQHILLGMNAHINLDLGCAAATVAPGGKLGSIKNDFMKVNQILNSLVNEMQDKVSKVSRFMFLADTLGKNSDEAFINFSMVKAREQAWKLATVLAALPLNEQEPVIETTDKIISELGEKVKNPPGKLLKMALKIIAVFEDKDVKTIVAKLRAN